MRSIRPPATMCRRCHQGSLTLALLGFVGREGWPEFAGSAEARDGVPDPLDRWSRRIIGRLAERHGAAAFFPFGGPPFLPFGAWAKRTEPVHPSPLGLLIHPDWGPVAQLSRRAGLCRMAGAAGTGSKSITLRRLRSALPLGLPGRCLHARPLRCRALHVPSPLGGRRKLHDGRLPGAARLPGRARGEA
ncbi:MAG: hypothetical protein WDN69_05835 [Aliidongia sp.]